MFDTDPSANVSVAVITDSRSSSARVAGNTLQYPEESLDREIFPPDDEGVDGDLMVGDANLPPPPKLLWLVATWTLAKAVLTSSKLFVDDDPPFAIISKKT